MQRLLALAVVASLAVTLTCRTAHGDPPDESAMRLPVPESERPITLPRHVASAAVGFTFDRYPGDLGYADLDVSGRFGVTDDFSHALVAPLQLSSPPGRGHFEYGQSVGNQGPDVGVTYRFVGGPVEVGADLTASVFTIPGVIGGSLKPSIPIRFHPTWALRLDVDPDVVLVRHRHPARVPPRVRDPRRRGTGRGHRSLLHVPVPRAPRARVAHELRSVGSGPHRDGVPLPLIRR